MAIVNVAYETLGSVPDIEGAGFLAGSLIGLVVLFPLLSALVVFGVTTRNHHAYYRFTVRAGGAVGLVGALFYLFPGAIMASRRVGQLGHIEYMWAAVILLSLLSLIGGLLGTRMGLRSAGRVSASAEL